MQLCTIYKCSKKADAFLFIEKADDFSKVPDALKKMIGTPKLFMTLDLDGRKKLGVANLAKVKSELVDKGFYFQLPPPEKNLLDQHKELNGSSQ